MDFKYKLLAFSIALVIASGSCTIVYNVLQQDRPDFAKLCLIVWASWLSGFLCGIFYIDFCKKIGF